MAEARRSAGELVSGVRGVPDNRLTIEFACWPVDSVDVPIDEHIDQALLASASSLLLAGWVVEPEPDATQLTRFGERVRLERSGVLSAFYTAQREGWDLDPPHAINSTDLLSDLLTVSMLPFALHSEDRRYPAGSFGAAIGLRGWAGKLLFFPPSVPASLLGIAVPAAPGHRVGRDYPLSEPSDALRPTLQVVRDFSRVMRRHGVDTWATVATTQLPGHNDRLRAWEARLGL
jgi:hypothetical protein